MANAARPVLDPQTETGIIDAIIALDWSIDIVQIRFTLFRTGLA